MIGGFGEGGFERNRESLFSESEILLAWLVEVAPGDQDPNRVASKRQLLKEVFQQLGVWDEEQGLDIYSYVQVAQRLFDNRQVVVIPDDFPFEDEVSVALTSVKKKDTDTKWSELQPRMNLSEEEYILNIGAVMSNRFVYESVFKDDPMEFGGGDMPKNGRHRWLTNMVFEEMGYKWNDWEWIKKVVTI